MSIKVSNDENFDSINLENPENNVYKTKSKKKQTKKKVEKIENDESDLLENIDFSDNKKISKEKTTKIKKSDIEDDNDELIKKKAKYITQINAIFINPLLSPILKKNGLKQKDYVGYNLDKLKLELEILENVLNQNDDGNNSSNNHLKYAIKILEKYIHDNTKYKIKGTAEELFNKDKFVILLERIKIKYRLNIKLPIELDLMLMMAMTTIEQHNKNINEQKINSVDINKNLDEKLLNDLDKDVKKGGLYEKTDKKVNNKNKRPTDEDAFKSAFSK